MTRPDPRPLASVTRLRPPVDQATIAAAELVAMRAAIVAACGLQRSIRDRKASREHRVPMSDLRVLEARLNELAAILEENA